MRRFAVHYPERDCNRRGNATGSKSLKTKRRPLLARLNQLQTLSSPRGPFFSCHFDSIVPTVVPSLRKILRSLFAFKIYFFLFYRTTRPSWAFYLPGMLSITRWIISRVRRRVPLRWMRCIRAERKQEGHNEPENIEGKSLAFAENDAVRVGRPKTHKMHENSRKWKPLKTPDT